MSCIINAEVSENTMIIPVETDVVINSGGGGGGGNYQVKSVTYTPSGSQQTDEVTPGTGYDALSKVNVTINAAPAGTAGVPTASKGAVSNHSVTVTPSVTNVTGWITGGTTAGSGVVVQASELVSGSETKTANGTYDVTNLAQLVVNVSGTTVNEMTLLADCANANEICSACMSSLAKYKRAVIWYKTGAAGLQGRFMGAYVYKSGDTTYGGGRTRYSYGYSANDGTAKAGDTYCWIGDLPAWNS